MEKDIFLHIRHKQLISYSLTTIESYFDIRKTISGNKQFDLNRTEASIFVMMVPRVKKLIKT